jgi:hypothetical protein
MGAAGQGFDWIGADGETRLLLHRGCGYSIAIPGQPAIATDLPAPPPAYDVVVRLSAPVMELGFRLDTLPVATEPVALATALALTYSAARAGEQPAMTPQPAVARAVGADAAVTGMYAVAPAALATMEHLMVLVRRSGDSLWALYGTIRFSRTDVNAIRWAHVRTAMMGAQHWDPAAARTSAPRLFPEASPLAEPSAKLDWTDDAWAEAQAKAADLGPLTDRQTQTLVQLLIDFTKSDDPPTLELHPAMIQLITQRVSSIGASRAAEVLLRNVELVKTTHDLRAWCWQCVWAIGNRADLSPEQRGPSGQSLD